MRRAGRRQMQIWVSGMPSFDTPRLQLFFDVAFEKAVSGLAIECNRTNSRMIGQQAYDLIRLLPADIAVETPFAFTAPADVPQCDSRRATASPCAARTPPAEVPRPMPRPDSRRHCADGRNTAVSAATSLPASFPKPTPGYGYPPTGSKLCNISVPSLNSTLNPAASR